MSDHQPTPTAEQIAALRSFAARNGRYWKRELNLKWFNGRDADEPEACYLRQVRNILGPTWLHQFSFKDYEQKQEGSDAA
jgi:hypothetical protein